MCGIAGCIGYQDTWTVNRMLDAMRHRGPNGRGVHCNGHGAFGHTRLSIVDVAHGHQPILAGSDNRTGVICNGEIYNFQDLRRKLSRKYAFKTRSDSETVLHLYRHMGPECVQELDGMFALCVFDGPDFLLARDPIGIKPLYYAHHNGHLYFTSELGAMTLAGVDEIHEFPAGHYYTPKEGFVRYYQLPEVQNRYTDVDETIPLMREALIQSVKKRLLADPEVPVGSFCSGGLDSSLVAAIAAEEIPNLHTFVVGTCDENGDESDDLKASRIVAEHIGSTHHEYLITEEEYYEVLPLVIKELESYDPALVRGAVPNYFTCQLASDYVTVVLTGEGADECFTGYHYMKHFPRDRLNEESRRCVSNLHNIDLQRADRMGMFHSLELRVPFLDMEVVDLAMKIDPRLKIREHNGARIEKWIVRKAFEDTGYLPDDLLWRYKVQYSQGAGCQNLGEKIAHKEISDADFERIKAENPQAEINSREAAYYYTIFRRFHPQDSILGSIGIWKGFDFDEERQTVRGTVDGELKHDYREDGIKA